MRLRSGPARGAIGWRCSGLSVTLAVAVCVLAACSESGGSGPAAHGAAQPLDTGAGDVQAFMTLAPPEPVSRAIDPAALRLTVTLDDEPVTMRRDGENFSGTLVVQPGATADMMIQWDEALEGGALPLARHLETIGPVNTDLNVVIAADAYVTGFDPDAANETGIFDLDDDGLSNLAERSEGSDPRDINSPVGRVHVSIPRLPEGSSPPPINAVFENVWRRAQYSSQSGKALQIDNLMVGEETDLRGDRRTEFHWAALHDDTYLYVMVFGEQVVGAQLWGDSVQAFNDDTIDIFIDADNSKSSSYGPDDYHMLVPLLKSNGEANVSGAPGSRFEAGANSAPLPAGVSFAACRCAAGQHVWELRLPLAGFGLAPGLPFGIDVQINDDRDGNERDNKWGWAHPSRLPGDEKDDNTWRIPAYMATGVLEP